MTDKLYTAATFEEFWQHYQELHASRSTRVAHAIGTTTAILLLARAVARRSVKLAIAAPVIDYAIAQASHRAEGVATHPHKKPLWHARAELRLWRSTISSFVHRRGGRGPMPDDEPSPIELPPGPP